MKLKVLLITALAVTPSLASAQTQAQIKQRYSREYRQCLVDAGMVDLDVAQCAWAEASLQDGRLNQAYVMVMRRLPAPRKLTLRNLQRTWIKQRDNRCRLEPGAGTLDRAVQAQCLLDETIKRTLFLETYKG